MIYCVMYLCVYIAGVFAFLLYACRTASVDPADLIYEDDDRRPCVPPISVRDLLAMMEQQSVDAGS